MTSEEIREVLQDSRKDLAILDRKRHTLEIIIDACLRLLKEDRPAAPLGEETPSERPLRAGTVRARIVTAMREAGTPMKAREIQVAVACDDLTIIRSVLTRLRAAGEVACIGRSRGAMWRLRVNGESDAPPKAPPKQAISPELRDKAILTRLGKGPATSEDLLRILPDVDDGTAPFVHLAHALRRLELYARIVKLGPDLYTVA